MPDVAPRLEASPAPIAFVSGALDEKYAANSFIITFANSYVVGVGERRTYGITARYRF